MDYQKNPANLQVRKENAETRKSEFLNKYTKDIFNGSLRFFCGAISPYVIGKAIMLTDNTGC